MDFAYTNTTNISLPLTVFLLNDTYDKDSRPNCISATGLIRPIKQLVLSQQNPDLSRSVDISELIASRMGTALHDAFEASWKNETNIRAAMIMHGIPESAIDKVRINPKEIKAGDIPIYLEQRSEKEIDGYIITGKYDLVLYGNLSDLKSTSVWSIIYGSNDEDYIKQGSIYKWLNPGKITGDILSIQLLFTDWSAVKAKQDRQYPQTRAMTKKFKLWPVEQTEGWIRSRLDQFKQLLQLPQSALPDCTAIELWSSETKYKYYKNPAKTIKSTANFSSMDEAIIRKANDGDVGIIKTIEGKVKRCQYCEVIEVCNQAAELIATGRLVL